MTSYMPAVIGFEDGGDYIHWFPWVVLEYDETKHTAEQVSAVAVRIATSEVLLPEGSDIDEDDSEPEPGEDADEDDEVYYDPYESTDEGAERIRVAFANRGIELKVHNADSMEYIAPRGE